MTENDSQSSPASIVCTEDGSQTIISPLFQERYHSIYGAKQESQTVFIDAGLKDRWNLDRIEILEMGFGTGLNALMSLYEVQNTKKHIAYTGYEKFPVAASTVDQLSYGEAFELQEVFNQLHKLSWQKVHTVTPQFSFQKIHKDINLMSDKNKFDVVYFDAFAPAAQEELWTVELFTRMYNALQQNGVLVTYCAKGQVKRNLKAAGFVIEPLPGPPGKREMTRARKL